MLLHDIRGHKKTEKPSRVSAGELVLLDSESSSSCCCQQMTFPRGEEFLQSISVPVKESPLE